MKGGISVQPKSLNYFLAKVLVGNDEERTLEDEEVSPAANSQTLGFEMSETKPCISLQAINGIQRFQTMRVIGYVGKKAIQILIDSGSTHNSMDQGLAHKLGCKLKPIHLQPIAVANGSELKCRYICHNFTWKLQGTKFSYDVLLIPLGSCDMVLGIQWLSQLGAIQWNFQTLQMEFYWKGKRHVLRGLQWPKVKIIQGTQLRQAMEERFHLCMMQLLPTKKSKLGVCVQEWCCLNLHQEAIPV